MPCPVPSSPSPSFLVSVVSGLMGSRQAKPYILLEMQIVREDAAVKVQAVAARPQERHLDPAHLQGQGNKLQA